MLSATYRELLSRLRLDAGVDSKIYLRHHPRSVGLPSERPDKFSLENSSPDDVIMTWHRCHVMGSSGAHAHRTAVSALRASDLYSAADCNWTLIAAEDPTPSMLKPHGVN